MIVLHHYFQLFFTTTDCASEHMLLYLLSQQLGYSGVAIFFFLSGYGLMQSEKKKSLQPKEFFQRRFLKIYSPYLFITLVWLPIFYFVNKTNDINITGIIYDLFWDGRDNVLWFIKILLFLYITFYIFSRLNRINMSYGIISLLIMTLLVCFISYYTIGNYSYISIPIFSIGIIYSIYQDKALTLQNPFLTTIILASIIIGISALLCSNIFFMMQALINYIIILLFIIYKDKISTNKENRLENISYDIYLTHNKVLMLFQLYFVPSLINLSIYLSFVFVTAYISNSIRKIFKI